MTKSDMASGRFMSAFGGAKKSKRAPMPSTVKLLQTKIKRKSPAASGMTEAPRGPMVPSTCLVSALIPTSQAAWSRRGTPLVIWRCNAMAIAAHTTSAAPVAHTVSMLSVNGPNFCTTWSPTVMLLAARSVMCESTSSPPRRRRGG